MKSFDLRDFVKKALEIARDRGDANGTVVEVDLPKDLPHILGDEGALTEAFAHLVADATEATDGRPKPRVTLAAKTGSRRRRITARGIDP